MIALSTRADSPMHLRDAAWSFARHEPNRAFARPPLHRRALPRILARTRDDRQVSAVASLVAQRVAGDHFFAVAAAQGEVDVVVRAVAQKMH